MIILVPQAAYEALAGDIALIAPEVTLVPYREDDSPIEHLDEAVAVIRWRLGRRFSSVIEAAPNVRWLHTESAGVDMVLTPAVRAKPGLTVTDSGPAYDIPIAEFVIAWMLAIAHRLDEQIAEQRAHRWKGHKQRELHGATAGIVGLGPIGRGIATRAKALGMRTLGYRRSNSAAEGIDKVLTGPDGLKQLLAESDYVILAAALTGDTRSLIGSDEFSIMKPSAWIINIARGALIDEAAMIEALKSQKIAGACLDVFAKEPLPQDSPLWDMPNVYISPHYSTGLTDALEERLKAIFLANLRRFVDGEPLLNVVDPARGY